jgi:hypothetical protein
MVPDSALRLEAALKALADVIAPAIPEDAGLAKEQIALVMRSISLAIEQIPLEAAYMARDSQTDRELAAKFQSLFVAGHPMSNRLADAISASENALPPAISDTRELAKPWHSLKKTLEEAVSALAKELGRDAQTELAEIMLAYSEERNLRERAWVASTGFDPDPESLPSLETVTLIKTPST